MTNTVMYYNCSSPWPQAKKPLKLITKVSVHCDIHHCIHIQLELHAVINSF